MTSAARARVEQLRVRLRIPVVAAPMFLVSGPELVIAASRAGAIGSFPAPNARTVDDLEAWCTGIAGALAPEGLPWAVNAIVHSSYDRLADELAVFARHRPPLVITALGSPRRVLDEVHAYGGLVFADVATPAHAQKAAAAGADGLVLVCAGAGGHTGSFSPFAFVREVRAFWDGPLILSGAIGDGRAIRAAELLGADLVYVGTRFIATRESLASEAYRQMLVEAQMADVVLSSEVTGVPANWLAASVAAAGAPAAPAAGVDFSGTISERKAWKHIWSAGHGVGLVREVLGVAELVDELAVGYEALAPAADGERAR
jgi:nitronate monooxygenase